MNEIPRYASRMVQVLMELRGHLETSAASEWSAATPAEVMALVDRQVTALLSDARLPERDSLRVLLLPTGDLQEIALDAGWGDAYLDLANRLDAELNAWPE